MRINQQAALEELRKEPGIAPYFDAIRKHPRMLVGMEVPSLTSEGKERLKDSADAADWIDGVKAMLLAEVESRAAKKMDEDGGLRKTLHSSIELFQNNSDLVPGTVEFDKELADKLTELTKPYESRVDGKLIGYNIPLQPLVDLVRGQLKEARAAKATAQPPAGAPAAPQAPAQPPARKPAPAPQAGIPASAGTSAEANDFSTLFGTIGMPELRI